MNEVKIKKGFNLTPMYPGVFYPGQGKTIKRESPEWEGDWPQGAFCVNVSPYETKEVTVDGEHFKKSEFGDSFRIYAPGTRLVWPGTDEWSKEVTGILRGNMDGNWPGRPVAFCVTGNAQPFFENDKVYGEQQ